MSPKIIDDWGKGGGGGCFALYIAYTLWLKSVECVRVACVWCPGQVWLSLPCMLLQCVSITEQKLIHLQTRQRGRQVVNSILCTVCTMCTSCCVFFSIASASMIQSVSTYARTCQRVYLWCIMSHHPIFKYKSIKNQMDFCQGKYWYEYF